MNDEYYDTYSYPNPLLPWRAYDSEPASLRTRNISGQTVRCAVHFHSWLAAVSGERIIDEVR